MKLIISEYQAIRTFVSREFAATIEELVSTFGWKHVQPAELRAGRIRASLVDILGSVPDVILFWEGYWFINGHADELDGLDCRKALFADDIHDRGNDRFYLLWAAFLICDTILCTYKNAFLQFYPALAARKEVVWVPHAASPEFLLPFNERAENSILLSGAIGESYPLRQRMKALHDLGTWPIVRIPHPGYGQSYDHTRDERVGAGYARAIHRYRSAFTDCLIFGYLVAKHFEIAATGALLVADRAANGLLAQLGIFEGEHYIATSNDEMEETIKFVIDESHHRELDELRRRAQRLVSEKHTTRERARLIDDTFDDR
jgi:Glycosyl transferases group 1